MLWLMIKICIIIIAFPILLLFWPIVIIVYFLNLYSHRIGHIVHNSNLDKEVIKGRIGENIVADILAKIPGNKEIINNVLINDNGKSRQIDHIFINQKGVFVIETKNFSGSIYGKETSEEWTQYLNKKLFKFKNPIHQNYGHKKIVSQVISDERNVTSIVAFTDKCKLKVITKRNPVMYVSQLKNFIETQTTKLTDSKIEEYYNEIMENKITDEETIKNHKSNVRQYVECNNQLIAKNKCPRCDTGKLIVKKGKYGEFLGCTNYPKCRYTKQIEDTR